MPWHDEREVFIPLRPTDLLPRIPTLITSGHVEDHGVLNSYVREHPHEHDLLAAQLRRLERRQRWLIFLAVVKLIALILLWTVVR